MLTCFDVAKYFLSLCNDEESGDLISNLKIQKLVYYAQGFSLAINNKPLFKEKIQVFFNSKWYNINLNYIDIIYILWYNIHIKQRK